MIKGTGLYLAKRGSDSTTSSFAALRTNLFPSYSLTCVGIGISFSGQRPSAGTSKVIQRQRREKKSKTEQEKKHPTKLVKAATCCL